MSTIERLNALHDDLVRRDMYATARDVSKIIDGLRRELPETGVRAAWGAIVDVLDEVRGTQRNWGADDSLAPCDAAVAAIRSMAAQCSAQPTPRPATPRVTDYDLETIAAAIGVLYANDPVDDPIKLRLVDLFKSMRTNAPQE